MQDFTKLFAGMPGLNAEAFATAQKRNLETMVQAGQIVATGTQTVISRQLAVFQALAQESATAMQTAFGAKDAPAGIKMQMDFFTGLQQKLMALGSEIAEISQKTSQEAFEILRKRAEETTAEVVAFQKKAA